MESIEYFHSREEKELFRFRRICFPVKGSKTVYHGRSYFSYLLGIFFFHSKNEYFRINERRTWAHQSNSLFVIRLPFVSFSLFIYVVYFICTYACGDHIRAKQRPNNKFIAGERAREIERMNKRKKIHWLTQYNTWWTVPKRNGMFDANTYSHRNECGVKDEEIFRSLKGYGTNDERRKKWKIHIPYIHTVHRHTLVVFWCEDGVAKWNKNEWWKWKKTMKTSEYIWFLLLFSTCTPRA